MAEKGQVPAFMIIGVGIDLVSVNRIEKAYRRRPDRFMIRIYTEEEIGLLKGRSNFSQALAARFAAKEAVLKAIGCGIGPAGLKEVEVLSPAGRQPEVRLHGHAASRALERGITGIELSITHEGTFAGAIAVAYR